MYETKPGLRYSMSDSDFLWRYMDFTKFMSLLNDKALYFSRLDQVGDPFEGSFTLGDHEHFRMTRPVAAAKDFPYMPEEEREKEAQIMNDMFADIGKIMAHDNSKRMFVNCWHSNPGESAAMWKLYLKSDEGIAIRTTTKRFAGCFHSTPHTINIGEVNYIDYPTGRTTGGPGTPYSYDDPVFFKRIIYSHEREVRALIKAKGSQRVEYRKENGKTRLIDQSGDLPLGIKVEADLSRLVESIYVAPASPPWFSELVKQMTEKFGLEAAIHRSSLNESPIL